jgi:hypothetical protein
MWVLFYILYRASAKHLMIEQHWKTVNSIIMHEVIRTIFLIPRL